MQANCKSSKILCIIWHTIWQTSFLDKPCCYQGEYSWLMNAINYYIVFWGHDTINGWLPCFNMVFENFLVRWVQLVWYAIHPHWKWLPNIQLIILTGKPPFQNTTGNKFLKERASWASMYVANPTFWEWLKLLSPTLYLYDQTRWRIPRMNVRIVWTFLSVLYLSPMLASPQNIDILLALPFCKL